MSISCTEPFDSFLVDCSVSSTHAKKPNKKNPLSCFEIKDFTDTTLKQKTLTFILSHSNSVRLFEQHALGTSRCTNTIVRSDVLESSNFF